VLLLFAADGGKVRFGTPRLPRNGGG